MTKKLYHIEIFMPKFLIKGGKALQGEVLVSGSKNAALPILAATLLTTEPCIIKNLPDIADTMSMLELLKSLGARVKYANNTAIIHAEKIKKIPINDPVVKKMRASILLIGPLLARQGEANIDFPGGCVLGKRSVNAHLHALYKLGYDVKESNSHLNLKKSKRGAEKHVVMTEMSVTATENAIMAAVLGDEEITIHLAACEPHVQDLCRFLNKMGARIKGIGTHTLIIQGVKRLKGTTYHIISDYLEAGTLALAAVLTRGNVTIKGVQTDQLHAFWNMLKKVGASFTLKPMEAVFSPSNGFKAVEKLRTAVYPSFPTDLQAPFAILLTQAQGESFIFETLFDGRLNYLFELEKMGAKIEILNPHQAKIIGETPLKGVPVASCDIRAGTAMVLAALIAKGETEISNIYYIDRGYEKLDEKLRKLGADITRIDYM